MKKINNKKGFTLVELIVVIVIIGILASILVPNLTAYIRKAKRSNDVETASFMTRDLNLYSIENDKDLDNIDGLSVMNILTESLGYSLVPTTSYWTYVFNPVTKVVEVKDLDSSTSASFDSTDITAFSGCYLIGKGNSKVEQVLYAVLTEWDFSGLSELDSEYSEFKTNLEWYQKNGILITETEIIKDEQYVSSSTSHKAVIASGLMYIPAVKDTESIIDNTFVLVNKYVNFVVAGGEDVAEALNVGAESVLEIENLKDIIDVYSNNVLINNEEKLNKKYDSSNFNLSDFYTKAEVFGTEDTDGFVFKLNSNYDSSCKIHLSFSKVESRNDASVYKLSIMGLKNGNVVGYREIYYIVEIK